jgi:preprotein translocase subunit SecD
MKRIAILLSVSVCLTAGCSKPTPIDNQAAAKEIARICPVFLRHEKSDRTLDPYPFIRPEHVAFIGLAKPYYKGEKAIWIQLTSSGSERMYRETKDSVGSRIAFFCGSKEIERAVIQAPIQGGFRVALPSKGGA